MTNDSVFHSFLEAQDHEALDLDQRSDMVDIEPIGPRPASMYRVTFHCEGLVKTADGIRRTNRHEVGIRFGPNHLRCAPNVAYLLTWISPVEAYHTNIAAPFICVGPVPPGMTLVNLIYQTHQIISWQRFSPHDALNGDACSWARANIDALPIDPRRSLLRPAATTARG